jgi:hypothetical protein
VPGCGGRRHDGGGIVVGFQELGTYNRIEIKMEVTTTAVIVYVQDE